MEAKELRIGNLILNFIDEVIDVNIAVLAGLDNAHKPIPLTEEWLVKFGFVGESKDYYLKSSLVLKWGSAQSPEDGWLFHYGKAFARHIKYVHQLQNLYFALTGEELEIK